jgi:hypothetical protein
MGFWRNLTTSRYTRHLEQQNEWLRSRVEALEECLIPRLYQIEQQKKAGEAPEPNAKPDATKMHPLTIKRVGLSQRIRQLEHDPAEDRAEKLMQAHANIHLQGETHAR